MTANKMNISSKIKDLKNLNDNFNAEMRKIIDDSIQELFTESPEIAQARFIGYTPYFNDGDECVYLMDPSVILVESLKDLANDPGNDDLWKYSYKGNKIVNFLADIPKAILRNAFGDGVKVKFIPNLPYEIEKYDHE